MPNKLEIIINADGTRAIKSLKEVAATAAATGKETAQAAKLAELARKFEAETITSTSVKIIQARRNESVAASDYRKVQQQIRDGALSEVEGVTLEAAAYQKLAAARLRAAEAAAVESKGGLASVLHDRVTEHLGSLGITESMAGMTAVAVGAVAVIAELGNKLREVTTEALEFGEQMKRASEKTGLSVETLSVLRYAAKTTGGDFDSMTAAVAKMDKTIGQATEGNKTAQAFMKSLGLDARELASSPDGAEVAFKKFATTLAATENPIQRVQLATALLGKAGADQIPTLIDLGTHWDETRGKAAAAGQVMSAEVAKQLEETNKKLKDMGMAVAGAGLSFTEGFAPGLDRILDVLASGQSHLDLFKAWGEDIVRILAAAASAAYGLASGLARVDSIQSLGPLTAHGRAAAADATEWDKKSQEMMGVALGHPAPGKSRAQEAYEAGLGGGQTDPFLDAIRKRNAAFAGVGDLTHTPDKAAEERLRAMELELDNEKRQFGMTLKTELEYWDARIGQFDKKSAEYKTISDKETAIAVAGANASAAVIKRFKEQQLHEQISGDRERDAALAEGGKAMRGMSKDRDDAQRAAFGASNDIWAAQQQAEIRRAEFSTQSFSTNAGKQARQMAELHELSYMAASQNLASKANEVNSSGLTDAEKGERLRRLADEQARLDTERALQQAEDAKRIESTTLLGGANDALREFMLEATDAGAAMKQWLSGSLNTTNDAIVRAMTGGKADFGAAGHEIFTNATSSLLKSAEGNLMKALGIGGKKDGSSEAAALWVRIVQASGGSPSGIPGLAVDPLISGLGKLAGGMHLPGMPENNSGAASSASFLSKLGGFAMHVIPGFATGTDFAPGGMALLGEDGPEIVNLPRGSSVTPNNRLGTGGDTHQHTWNIDARGASDPAAVRAQVIDGIREAAPHIIAAAARVPMDRRNRMPASAR